MNWTRIGAVLMILTLCIHVFGGGPEVHEALLRGLSEPALAAFASVLWHAVTVVLAVLAFGLWQLAKRNDAPFELVLSGIQIGFAVLFIVYGLSRLGTLWPMPQWIVFLIIPALTRFGQSRKKLVPSP
jgi:uncharacterized membrane protein